MSAEGPLCVHNRRHEHLQLHRCRVRSKLRTLIDVPNATIAGSGRGSILMRCQADLRSNAASTERSQPKETKTLSLTLNIDAPAGTKSSEELRGSHPAATAAPGGGPRSGPAAEATCTRKEVGPRFPPTVKSLLHFASFRPQSLLPSARVLSHLAGGGAGGNIGGVGPNNCLKWGMDRDGFNVTQSNGPQVGFEI